MERMLRRFGRTGHRRRIARMAPAASSIIAAETSRWVQARARPFSTLIQIPCPASVAASVAADVPVPDGSKKTRLVNPDSHEICLPRRGAV
jgi:hypothetical protein